jgi:hypothetical protein
MLQHQRKQKKDAFKRKFTAIDIVAQKKISRAKAADAKNPYKIVKTAVDVADDDNTAIDPKNNRLLPEVISCHVAELEDVDRGKRRERRGPAIFKEIDP